MDSYSKLIYDESFIQEESLDESYLTHLFSEIQLLSASQGGLSKKNKKEYKKELRSLENELTELKAIESDVSLQHGQISPIVEERKFYLNRLKTDCDLLNCKIQEISNEKSDAKLKPKLEDIENVETAGKTLYLLKRLLKVKWQSETDDQVDGFVFNECSCFLKRISYDKSDPDIGRKLWDNIRMATAYKSRISINEVAEDTIRYK